MKGHGGIEVRTLVGLQGTGGAGGWDMVYNVCKHLFTLFIPLYFIAHIIHLDILFYLMILFMLYVCALCDFPPGDQ